MLVSIDWIKEFVNINDTDSKALAEKFTLATAEVEGVILSGQHLTNMCVAEVIAIDKHPEADKLNLVTFKCFDNETRKVVCGASNVRVGLKTPFAPIGTVLPGGFELTPKKIRGVLSEGMLCSEEELGLKDSSEGIMELPQDASTGMNLAEYFQQTPDVILDIDNKSLTHRPDLWGHYGMAREFSAIYQEPLKNPFDEQWEKKWESQCNDLPSPVKVRFEGESAGLGYFGLTVEGITVGESPDWMRKRLESVGLRPINSIVDISNYVMLELGHPNHIFDRDMIKGDEVVIKKLDKNIEFQTLDEESRQLVSGDTVITDKSDVLVLAGIMGGLNSGVSSSTKSIFIEVANWKAADIRKTSSRLGLRTDSSQRFEKTLDSMQMKKTLLRILELVSELNPNAKVVGISQYDGEPLVDEELILSITPEKINSVLGVELETKEIIRILNSLDFKTELKEDSLSITVPSYRKTKDIECGDDIIEEVGRIVGYDNIPQKSPKLDVRPVRLNPAKVLHRKIQDFMSFHSTAYEVMTYPLIGQKLCAKSSWPLDNKLGLINALSKDHSIMRDSLVPSLLEAMAVNSKNFHNGRFFELGRRYLSDKKEFRKEVSTLGIVFFDKDKNVFNSLADNVDGLLRSLNITFQFSGKHPKFKNEAISEDWVGLHPHEFLNIQIMGKMKGVIFSVHPMVLKSFKIKGNVSIALIDIGHFENNLVKSKMKYRPLPKFPNSKFDLTVLASADTGLGDVLKAASKAKLKELENIEVFDVFTESDGKKAVTLRATFADPDRTLPPEVLNKAQELLISTLNKSGFILK
ncbi:MAG: phenylalanine--tRNA ligase subunit beta [Bacteriovoracaceae bacterium]